MSESHGVRQAPWRTRRRRRHGRRIATHNPVSTHSRVYHGKAEARKAAAKAERAEKERAIRKEAKARMAKVHGWKGGLATIAEKLDT